MFWIRVRLGPSLFSVIVKANLTVPGTNNHVVSAEVWKPDGKLLPRANRTRIVDNTHGFAHALNIQGLPEWPVRVKLSSKLARCHNGDVCWTGAIPSNEVIPASTQDGRGLWRYRDGHVRRRRGVRHWWWYNYHWRWYCQPPRRPDVPSPPPPPTPDVQQQFFASGDSIQSMRDDLRRSALEDQKKRLVDTFSTKCTVPIGCAQAGSTIDSSELATTAKRYTGSPATARRSVWPRRKGDSSSWHYRRWPPDMEMVIQMRCRTRWGSRTSGKRLLKAAEETIQKEIKSLSPTDIDSADPKDLFNFAENERRMIDRALAAVGDEPDVSAWLLQAVRELNGFKKVREKFRECHNHKPQPFPDPKRKRRPINPNKRKSNKRTKSTTISSLFPKRGNRNTKRTKKHKKKNDTWKDIQQMAS